MHRILWAFLTISLCLGTPALAYTFTGKDPLQISLKNKRILTVGAQFCQPITGLKGYVVATPALLEKEKIEIYLQNESKVRVISIKDHFMNAISSATYDAKSKSIKIIGHINPQAGLAVNYSLATGKARFSEIR